MSRIDVPGQGLEHPPACLGQRAPTTSADRGARTGSDRRRSGYLGWLFGDHLAVVAVLVTGLLTAAWLAFGLRIAPGPRLALLVAALGSHVVAVLALRRRTSGSRLVLVVGGLLLVLAVALPPHGSKDLWAYAMQGRVVAVHHANPYTHVPADYPHDPALLRMAHGWRKSPTPYGPAFTAVEAGVAWIAGGSALATRLLFQGIEALGVVAIVLALRRRTEGTAAVAFVLMSPVVLATVNGGHNDVLVGAAILGAVLLADRRRMYAAAALVALAALIKLTALLVIPAIAIWLVRRGRTRSAGEFSALAAGLVGVGYLLAGGRAALAPVISSAGHVSRASLLSLPHRQLSKVLENHGFTSHAASSWSGHAMTLVTVCCILGVLAFGWRRARRAESSAVVVIPTLTALTFMMLYVLPWYVLWVLPTAATRVRGRSTAAAWLLASALAIAYNAPPGVRVSAGWEWLGHLALPAAATTLIVLTVIGTFRHHRLRQGTN